MCRRTQHTASSSPVTFATAMIPHNHCSTQASAYSPGTDTGAQYRRIDDPIHADGSHINPILPLAW